MKQDREKSSEENNSNLNEPPDDDKQVRSCLTIDDGTEAFIQWMGSSDKKSVTSDNPIILKKFVNDVHTVLYDTSLSKEIDIKLTGGIPYCSYCKSDECAHVGFTICLEQLEGHRPNGEEETVDDIVDS
ncbi:MAG TPA: hypothetical protein VH415_00365 [Nitrososphaeraceae archaeon]